MSKETNILIVDDNEDLAANIQDILVEKGYRCATAFSGAGAIDRCREESFDIVLLDFKLPDMDGLQLQERLSELIRADYVIITGDASVESAAAAVSRRQIIAYETKPLDMDRLLAFIRQIHERRRMERELKKSRDRYRNLYDALMDALLVHSLEEDGSMGNFREVNDIACQRYGYSREELLGMSPFDLLATESSTEVGPIIEELHRGKSITFEQIHLTREGRGIPVEIHAKAFQLDGKPAVISLVRDITDRKRAETERRLMERQILELQRQESLGVMAGGIAHDFNNILMVVIGYIEMALDDQQQSHTTRHFLEESRNAVLRAIHLVNQMLAYSGKGHFQVEPVELNPMVRRAVQTLRDTFARELIPETRLTPENPVIAADTAQVQKILENLVVNAYEALQEKQDRRIVISTGIEEYTAEGLKETEPEVWLGYEPPLKGGLFGFLEVEENGCGMDSGTRKRLFEPFFTSKFQGRGLGLCAVIGMVRGHRGFIRIDSAPGKGTKFRVLFPLQAGEAEIPAPEEVADKNEKNAIGVRQVLVVDDEETVRNLIQLMLESLGCEVRTAANGIEAISCFHRHTGEIDLILMDLSMPLMGGLEVFAELRRIGCTIPVILISGYSETEIQQEFSDKGFAGFLQKPFRKGALEDLLESVVH